MAPMVITEYGVYGNHKSRLKFPIQPNGPSGPFGPKSSCFVNYQKNIMHFMCEDIECLFGSFPDLDKQI